MRHIFDMRPIDDSNSYINWFMISQRNLNAFNNWYDEIRYTKTEFQKEIKANIQENIQENTKENGKRELVEIEFKIPKSKVFILSMDEYRDLGKLIYDNTDKGFKYFKDKNELKEHLTNKIDKFIKVNDLDYPLFFKNDVRSFKFDAKQCMFINNKSEIFDKIVNTIFNICMMGGEYFPILVFREKISIYNKENILNYDNTNIYNELPLIYEFRAFIDFKNKEIIDILDYWDKDEFEAYNRKDCEYYNDYLTYIKWYDKYIVDNENHKKCIEKLKELITLWLKANEFYNLDDVYSVDFLITNDDKYYLIDMAVGVNSAMYEKVKDKIKDKIKE